jgi:hypothetical protein
MEGKDSAEKTLQKAKAGDFRGPQTVGQNRAPLAFRSPWNHRSTEPSVDPMGFEPASAAVARCRVSVPPRAQPESTTLSVRSQVWGSRIEHLEPKTGARTTGRLLGARTFLLPKHPQSTPGHLGCHNIKLQSEQKPFRPLVILWMRRPALRLPPIHPPTPVRIRD